MLNCLAPAVPASAAAKLTRGPYLQIGTPTSVVVRWRTDEATTSLVRYGAAKDKLDQQANSAGILTEHIVQLDRLEPATRYYYAIGTATETLAGDEGCTFVTTPPPGPARPTRVWVLGDSGTKNDHARAVRDAYAQFAGNRDTDFWLMLGDNAYEKGSDTEYQAAVFDLYPAMLKKSVLWPTLGNHDASHANSITQSGVYYDIFTLPTLGQAGGIPSGTEAYYAFDHANVHFICLDSHDTDRSPTGAMMAWLKADLAATKRDWIIAFFHHPLYTKGSHDSDKDTDSEGRMRDMRVTFLPALEAGGVDLILTGHSHSYERSFLLDGHYGTSDTLTAAMIRDHGDGRPDGSGAYKKASSGPAAHEGHVSVVAGSSGKTSGGALNHKAMFISLNELGSLVLDFDGARVNATFLNSKGEQRDHFTILKGAGKF